VARRRLAARMERRSARGPALPSALWTTHVRSAQRSIRGRGECERSKISN
jgi:hypothetical protein